MKKFSKKGFTLIEMLVVIAIIAILVSIIVPVVGNSTVKAAAATNAANLRNAAASIAVEFLEDKLTVLNNGTLTGYSLDAPRAKVVKASGIDNSSLDFTAKVVENNIICTYGTNTVEMYADIADNGKQDIASGESGCPCTAFDGEQIIINGNFGTSYEYETCSCGHDHYDHVNSGSWMNPSYGACKK